MFPVMLLQLRAARLLAAPEHAPLRAPLELPVLGLSSHSGVRDLPLNPTAVSLAGATDRCLPTSFSPPLFLWMHCARPWVGRGGRTRGIRWE